MFCDDSESDILLKVDFFQTGWKPNPFKNILCRFVKDIERQLFCEESESFLLIK